MERAKKLSLISILFGFISGFIENCHWNVAIARFYRKISMASWKFRRLYVRYDRKLLIIENCRTKTERFSVRFRARYNLRQTEKLPVVLCFFEKKYRYSSVKMILLLLLSLLLLSLPPNDKTGNHLVANPISNVSLNRKLIYNRTTILYM